jgi:biotin carboxyl carrier protein
MHLVDLTALETPGHLEATVNGRNLDLIVMDELKAKASVALDAGAGGRIVAEIPGLVIGLEVEAGQAVTRGQPVLVLEAMKMQNEITAPVDGVVGAVHVQVGQSVNAGDALLEIEVGA